MIKIRVRSMFGKVTYQQRQKPPSTLQDELLELRRRRSVVAEMVNGRANRRE
jgi:hypothetical protein